MKYIFRQKVYEVEPVVSMWRNIYDKYEYPKIKDKTTQVGDEFVCECEISEPLLKYGDAIYLNCLSRKVVVEEVARSEDGTVVCYVTSVKKNHPEYDDIYRDCEKVVAYGEDWKRRFAEYKKAYKYKHKFFNFKGE